jgi:hypothetical protein
MKYSLMTFSLKEIAPTFGYIFIAYEPILSSFMRNTT